MRAGDLCHAGAQSSLTVHNDEAVVADAHPAEYAAHSARCGMAQLPFTGFGQRRGDAVSQTGVYRPAFEFYLGKFYLGKFYLGCLAVFGQESRLHIT